MSTNNPSVIERQGVGWSFTFDLRPRPEYVHLVVRGKPSPLRTQHLVEVFQTMHEELADEAGRPFPIITDLREDGSFSMEHLRTLDAFRKQVTIRSSCVILLVEDRQFLGSLFQMFVNVLSRNMAESQIEVALSLDEARAKIRTYRAC